MDKTCPECGGVLSPEENTTADGSYHEYCSTCKGKMSVYETPRQYKQRTGKDLPNSAPVYPRTEFGWAECRPYYVAIIQNWKIMVIANESGMPAADYRPEG